MTGHGEVLQRFTFEAEGLNYDSWFVHSDWLPPNELTSSAFGLVFERDAILLARLVDRGWDVPGGHIEAGETAEAAMQREVFEETGAVVRAVSVFGYQFVRLLSPRPEGHRYPYPNGVPGVLPGRIRELGPVRGDGRVGGSQVVATRRSPSCLLGTASPPCLRGGTG